MVKIAVQIKGIAYLIIQPEPEKSRPTVDWLIDGTQFKAQVYLDGGDLVLSNGLIRRAWRLKMNAACVAYDNLITGDPFCVLFVLRHKLLLIQRRFPSVD